jgi:hypothetical protein
LSAILALKSKTTFSYVLFIANLYLIGSVAFIGLRRSEIIDFGVVCLGVLWFSRRWIMPKTALLAGVLAVSAVVYSIGEVRMAARIYKERTGETVSLFNPVIFNELSLRANLPFDNAPGDFSNAIDFYNGLHIINYASSTGEYTLGSQTWNSIVFQYVPGQIIGYDIKNSLMIGTRNSVYDRISYVENFSHSVGTTRTGFGSSYLEFGYFGCLFFFLNSLLLAGFYSRAQKGSLIAQLGYLSFVSLGLVAFTHQAEYLITAGPLFSSALVLLAYWIKKNSVSARAKSSLSVSHQMST